MDFSEASHASLAALAFFLAPHLLTQFVPSFKNPSGQAPPQLSLPVKHGVHSKVTGFAAEPVIV